MAVSGQRTPGSSIETAELEDDSVTLAKMAEMATASFVARNTAGTGNPEVVSAATAGTMLGGQIATLKSQTATIPHTVVTASESGGALTVNLDSGNIQRLTLGASTAITITRGTTAKTVVLHFVGAYTISGWTTVDKWIPAGAPTFSGADNYVTLTFDGTTLTGQHGVAG